MACAVGPFEVLSFSVMLLVAFLACTVLLARLLPTRGISSDNALPLVTAAAVGGVAGARLAYVVAHWGLFADRPLDILKLNQGGLVFYGGVAGGVLAVWLTAALLRLAVPSLADAASVALPLGAAIGRVGCFLNGCCGGLPSDVAWAVRFPGSDAAVHPTQLYDAAYNIVVFGVALALFRRRSLPDGALIWLVLALYAVARFAVEGFRTQYAYVWGLSGAQLISIGVGAVSLTALAVALRRSGRGGDTG